MPKAKQIIITIAVLATVAAAWLLAVGIGYYIFAEMIGASL